MFTYSLTGQTNDPISSLFIPQVALHINLYMIEASSNFDVSGFSP